MKRLYVGAFAILFVALSTVLLAAPPDDMPVPNSPNGFHNSESPPDDFGPFS